MRKLEGGKASHHDKSGSELVLESSDVVSKQPALTKRTVRVLVDNEDTLVGTRP